MKSLRRTFALLVAAASVAPSPALAHDRRSPERRAAPFATPASPSASPALACVSAGARTKLPMRFEANEGQGPDGVEFLARGDGYTLLLSATEATLAVRPPAAAARAPRRVGAPVDGAAPRPPENAKDGAAPAAGAVVRMRLRGASPDAPAAGLERLAGVTNYLVGDPSAWRTNVPSYARVRYEGVYPGIDMVYYGGASALEYDFVVAPGADPNVIDVAYEGVCGVRRDARSGDLVLATLAGEIRQHAPVVYQNVDGERRLVAARYDERGPNRVGIAVGPYDRARPLVVDPVLSYSTFLGGAGEDAGFALASGSDGSVYVAGSSLSSNYPTAGALQGHMAGGTLFDHFFGGDAVVTKLSPDATEVIWSTYLGGRANDEARGIAVDASGAVYVAGNTESPDFPVASAVQGAYLGAGDGFVAKIAPAGSALVYSSYIGGGGLDFVGAVDVGPDGAATVVGGTASTNFPTLSPVQSAFAGGAVDGFVARVSASGSALLFATYLGGSDQDYAIGVDVGADGAAYVVGATISADFPTTSGALQRALGGAGRFQSGFVAKLAPAGSSLAFSTYIGGSNHDDAWGVATDGAGDVYVAGSTLSTDFPLVSPIQSAFGGHGDYSGDAWAAKIDPQGSAILYATYIGGESDDWGYGLAVDSTGAAYVLGYTSSRSFPVVDAVQGAFGGGEQDGFVTKIDPAGDRFVYSTFLGGSSNEVIVGGTGIYIDFSGNAYVVGITTSRNFPTTAGAFQAAFGGGNDDVFVSKIVDYYDLTWEPPVEGGAAAPPRFLSAVRSDLAEAVSAAEGSTASGAPAGSASATAPVLCYNVYRSAAPIAHPDPANIFASVPGTQTRAPHVPGGAFFAITACYANGVESEPSNLTSGGDGEAVLAGVLVGKQIEATGSLFTDRVVVTIDGIGFQTPAVVSADRTKVTQTGKLANGQRLKKYLKAHPTYSVSFTNSTGGIATVALGR